MNDTLQKFRYPELLVKDYKHWAALVRFKHVTLGSLVLVSKSEATALGDLSAEVWAEFAVVSKEMERLLTKTFSAEKFNYFALMMKDPQVHFHLIPRYSREIEFEGVTFKDPDWPQKSELVTIALSDETLKDIQESLLNNV